MSNVSGVAIGRGIQESLSQTSPAAYQSEALRSLFRDLVNQAKRTSTSDPSAVIDLLERIEHEVNKGEAANSGLLEKLLRTLHRQTPEIARRLTDGLSGLPTADAVSKSLNLGGPEAAPAAPTVLDPASALLQAIDSADMDGGQRAELSLCVQQIQQQITVETTTKGGWADLRKIQTAIQTLEARGEGRVDGLRPLLEAWLVNDDSVPTSIRILVKKML
jgi:hypothetical protein